MKRIGETLTVVVSICLTVYLLGSAYSNLLEGQTQSYMKGTIKLKSQLGQSIEKDLEDLNSRKPVNLQDAEAQMTTSIVIATLLVAGIICGLLAGKVASTKGYERGVWFFAGFFFNIIGLIAAAGIGRKTSESNKSD